MAAGSDGDMRDGYLACESRGWEAAEHRGGARRPQSLRMKAATARGRRWPSGEDFLRCDTALEARAPRRRRSRRRGCLRRSPVRWGKAGEREVLKLIADFFFSF
jgi:hypothetical protein